jgi:hypothetical protein
MNAIYEAQQPLDEGVLGKILSIGALLAGTIFTGCAGNQGKHMPTLDIDPASPVTDHTVNTLAMEIANEIHDEMDSSDKVTETMAWQAAKDIYKKLVVNHRQGQADMFARTINRKNREFFNAPPCCDDTQYDNTEQKVAEQHSEYNPETGYWEVKN